VAPQPDVAPLAVRAVCWCVILASIVGLLAVSAVGGGP